MWDITIDVNIKHLANITKRQKGNDAECLSHYCNNFRNFLITLHHSSRKPPGWTSPNFLCMLPVVVAWSSSDGVAICYVLPVFVDEILGSTCVVSLCVPIYKRRERNR